MTEIRAIVFDKDGTLIDFEASWAPGMRALLDAIAPNDPALHTTLAKSSGFDYDVGSFTGGSVFVNGTTEDMMEHWKLDVPSLDVSDVLAKGEVAFTGLTPMPLCDLPTVMNALRNAGFVLGVVTNAAYDPTMVQLEKLGILEHFAMVIGCDSGFTPKPAGDTITGFCAATGIEAKHVAMVGDSTHDLNAGRNAGVGLNVGVLSGPASRAQIEDFADIILDDITQLPEYLS
jgi:phosphoglycolate phosphatase